MVSQMRENQGGFGVTDEGDLVSQMRGLPPWRTNPLSPQPTRLSVRSGSQDAAREDVPGLGPPGLKPAEKGVFHLWKRGMSLINDG